MSEACPYLISVLNSTGHTERVCITEMMDVFPNSDLLLGNEHDDLYADLKVFWMIVTGTLAFFLRLGFAMLHVGMVARRNIQTILFTNVMDSCISCIVWLCLGYGIAWGDGNSTTNAVIGTNFFFGVFGEDQFARFFYTWSFCATSSTIVSGAVAERCTLAGYAMYSSVITAFVFPVVSHWLWTTDGWLSCHNYSAAYPVIDFSGAISVHMLGGCAALMGAIMIGPRKGRFPSKGGIKIEYGNTDIPMILYGTIASWYAWYGFNCGATLAFGHEMDISIRIALMNTFSAGSGGITVGLLMFLENGKWNVPGICRGIIGGLVSVTGSCHVITSWEAILIGVTGGFIYFWGRKVLVWLKIDDPLEVTVVHGLCGMWGGIAAAILAEKDLIEYDTDVILDNVWQRLGNCLLAIFCVGTWTCGISGATFYLASKTVGLRTEHGGYDGGLDMVLFGMPAYKDTEEYLPEHH